MKKERLKEVPAIAPVEYPEPEHIHWEQGMYGAFFCWFAYAILFPFSPFLGLSLLSVGALMVGFAFGKR